MSPVAQDIVRVFNLRMSRVGGRAVLQFDYTRQDEQFDPLFDIQSRVADSVLAITIHAKDVTALPDSFAVDVERDASGLPQPDSLVARFLCACATGWEGQYCSVNTDDCQADSCGPGVCIDELNAFTCDCASTGFTGDSCTTRDSCGTPPAVTPAVHTPTTPVLFGDTVAYQCGQGFTTNGLASGPTSFSRQCTATLEYDGADMACRDVDECVQAIDNGCAHNCVNTFGSFICTCSAGFNVSPVNVCT